jgi:hypothetical protein
MAYARFSEESDVYVFLSTHGALECCGCVFTKSAPVEDKRWDYESTADMIAHLEAHRSAGHLVPEYCFEGLEEDSESNDAFIAEAHAMRVHVLCACGHIGEAHDLIDARMKCSKKECNCPGFRAPSS